MAKTEPISRINTSIPWALRVRLDEHAAATGKTLAAIVTEALEKYLGQSKEDE